MPLCKFADEDSMFASTPVQNLFIQEFMLQAPGDYVKVYLYGLMQSLYPATAENSLKKFASSLNMAEDAVLRAFQYWQSRGLLRKEENDEAYEFLDLRSSLSQGPLALHENNLYTHGELSNLIAAAAPNHVFTQKEFSLLFDLKEIDGFEDEAIVSLVEYTVEHYKNKFPLYRLEGVAREWKEKELKTGERANEYRLGTMLQRSPAKKLLAAIGISFRNPTLEEHRLYLKWTEEWRFSPDAINEALKQMTGISNPNFKYLDKILTTLRERGLLSVNKIKSSADIKSIEDISIQKCLYRLGIPGMVTDSQRAAYKRWRNDYHLSEKTILAACDEVKLMGLGTFKDLESQLQSYAKKSPLLTEKQIAETSALDDKVRQIYRQSGSSGNPTPKHREMLEEWLKIYPMPIILEAAGRSSNVADPMSYTGGILRNWQKQGVETLEEAKNAKASTHKNKTGDKISSVHYQGERDYDEDTLSSLVTRFEVEEDL